MKRLRRETTVYGQLSRAQVVTMDFMTRNTPAETMMNVAMVCEKYDDGSQENLLVVFVGNEIEFHITGDGRIRTANPKGANIS